jgi:CDP-glycerol glycerophosphotransferase
VPLLASCADSLAESLPVRHHDPELSLKLCIRGNNKFLLNLQPPLKASEQGRTAQKALRRAYAKADAAPQDSVLFQCYRGEFATDSQLALDEGLRVSRPELARYWGVRDLSTELPEGSLPVVIGTQEWYDVLAASRYLCNNIDFDGFFRKRPYQRYLQTFHGYPFKSMGTSFWAGKGFAPDRIARECERRNADWDAILVPTEECAEFYRTEYSYSGDVLVTGYPRADFVVNADRAKVRQHVLERLGVPQDKTVVLYAPTYRDELTTRTYAAKRFDELDLGELTEGLGPEVVILVRGHNNNQREPDRVRSVPNVVDVTDYPEINELTVAADAAILDYSSLRFEWALTGRPAVFFVPDVDTYFARRPPLFDYAGTAPGPWLKTTAEVVDTLRDLDEVSSKYAAEMAEFNARFNALHDGKATDRVIKSFFS